MAMPTVINAAGKLTALGGSAQSPAVAAAQAEAAQNHVDLAALRAQAGQSVAALTGAEAGCITSGAAAGIAIAVAAVITGTRVSLIQALPQTQAPEQILLQAGHAVNFGASVEQMIRVGGGSPERVGETNHVSPRQLAEALETKPTALLYVQSHHCVQDNMVALDECIALGHAAGVPVIVDAAAEEDLTGYIAAGADLVTYSGGKAFGGPTVGFICGRKALIEACEMQFQGIARTMKVGKEAICGLLAALDEYVNQDEATHREQLRARNSRLLEALQDDACLALDLKADEAGRAFERVRVAARDDAFEIRDLVRFLAEGTPSIRTRNHHVDQGYLLLDPRELHDDHIRIIAERIKAFATTR